MSKITTFISKLFNVQYKEPQEEVTEPVKNNNSPIEPLEMSDKIKGIIDDWTLDRVEETYEGSHGYLEWHIKDVRNDVTLSQKSHPYARIIYSLVSNGVEFVITRGFYDYADNKVRELKAEESAVKKRPILDNLGYD